jgi:hypothetical protein
MQAAIAGHLTQRAHAKKEADYHARTHILMPRPPADTRVLIPTSIVLQRLHDEVPTDHFTLGWLKHSLHKSSFGIIMLLLALVAIAPGASIVAGLLLMIPALQMIAGNPRPSLSTPHRHLFFADETPHRCGATTPPSEMVKRATGGLRTAGVPNINFDLIYGPPHQNAAALCRTVERCVAMKPDRIPLL